MKQRFMQISITEVFFFCLIPISISPKLRMLNKKKREIEILLDPYPVKVSSATIFRGPLTVKEWVPDKNIYIKKTFADS